MKRIRRLWGSGYSGKVLLALIAVVSLIVLVITLYAIAICGIPIAILGAIALYYSARLRSRILQNQYINRLPGFRENNPKTMMWATVGYLVPLSVLALAILPFGTPSDKPAERVEVAPPTRTVEHQTIYQPSPAATATSTLVKAAKPSNTPRPTNTLRVAQPTATKKPPTAVPTRTSLPTPIPDAVVITERLNVRSGPGINYDVLGTVNEGDALDVTGQSPGGSWIKVETQDGMEGWVSSDLVELNISLQHVPFAPTPPPPVQAAPPTSPPQPTVQANCHPSYPDVCIPPPPPDLDCGDIPYRNFRVVGSDPHRFDGDHDGIGCER